MTPSQHLFISDVHLGAFSTDTERTIEETLISLIEYALEYKAQLYILGDLFDYWMEYPSRGFVPDLGHKVLDAFEEYNKTSGMSAVYVTGNHDNWTFGHFEDRGFDVEPNYREFELESHKVLIMHGDGQFGKRDDFIRPAFHRILRQRLFTSVFQRVFPPETGLGIMKSFSDITRKRNYENPKPLDDHARRILKSHDLEVVMCGHDHIPRVETFSDGTYINLGAFFKHFTLVRYINNSFNLVRWHREDKEFVPYVPNYSHI